MSENREMSKKGVYEEGSKEEMKMVIVVVHDHDAHQLMSALTKGGFRATKLASTGGFLREGNTTFMIGVKKEKVDQIIDIINENCRSRKKTITPMSTVATSLESYYSLPMEVQIGGATVFIINIEKQFSL
ncbi:MAG TPA: cyclic-di-AMP receptor [Halanaerobiales bacterium]|nr:cyclic-di-AMP receptor [Halanaerobiales bacterium]